MQIIGIAGQLANGKDVLAEKLYNLLDGKYAHANGNKWKYCAWADGLKQVFYDSFKMTKEKAEEWKRKDEVPPGFNITVRKAFQTIGQTFREIKDDVWVNWTLDESDHGTIITDTRHIDEMEVIKSKGYVGDGFNILVYRPGYLNDSDHPSEAQLRDIVKYFAEKDDGKFEGVVNSTDLDKDAPMGASLINYFIRNDSDVETFKTKIEKDLMNCLILWFDLKKQEISIQDNRRIFVPKGWGYEDWIVNNEKYCGKELFFKKERRCSFHYHCIKEETFFISSGKLLIVIANDDQCIRHDLQGNKILHVKNGREFKPKLKANDWILESPYQTSAKCFVMEPGDHFHVPPRLIHAMYGLQDTKMFEFSTQHLDSDSYRLLKGD